MECNCWSKMSSLSRLHAVHTAWVVCYTLYIRLNRFQTITAERIVESANGYIYKLKQTSGP